MNLVWGVVVARLQGQARSGFGKTGDMLNVVVTSAESTPPSSTQPHRQDGSEHEWLPGSILTKLLPCLTAH